MAREFFGKVLNALPGASKPEEFFQSSQSVIGELEIKKATEILQKYKQGKSNLEQRIIEEEQWYKLRHWEAIRKKSNGKRRVEPEATSAWLFNAIINKHADAMDNYPEPVVLPREQGDTQTAKELSSVLPVVLEYNDFERTYSDAWWKKLKHGTAVYGSFWNPEKENGLGDIDIHEIDLLKIFWEPGITDIQKSRNLFIVDLVDNDILFKQYPQINKKQGNAIDISEYVYDDQVDTSDKSAVVDWYYKVKKPNGQSVVHYVKFVGDSVLYASENDPEYAQVGFYAHGKYPVDFDVMFPEEGTPVGFGYVAICKDPQIYIDKLSSYVLESSMMNVKKRFFVSESTNINEADFLDWTKPLIRVAGEVDEARIKELQTKAVDSNVLNVLQMKIDEMKDTASNKDVNSGGTGSGVTAASAIAALQEAGNKVSRDIIAASYRVYTDIASKCIELIAQFYDEARTFRITGMFPGQYEFISINNSRLKDQPMLDANGVPMMDDMGVPYIRKPVFDLKVKAQKKSPFSRMEYNELAQTLFSIGAFNPERAQETSIMLSMMDFEGIEDVKEKVSQGMTLLNILNDMTAQVTGVAMQAEPISSGSPSTPLTNSVSQAQAPMTSYGQALAKRSTPSMESRSDAANPNK